MKKCSNCFELKPIDAFYTRRSGFPQARCKACNAEVSRAWRHSFNRARSSALGLTYDFYVRNKKTVFNVKQDLIRAVNAHCHIEKISYRDGHGHFKLHVHPIDDVQRTKIMKEMQHHIPF